MTTAEFSNQFDIFYNSIATNNAPSIDLYEKSVYLTKAQLEIVKNYFEPKGNKYQKGFEQSSKRRNDLSQLIRNYKSITVVTSNDSISDNSIFFRIPNNTFIIIQEKALINDVNSCNNGTYVKIKPITHDEFNIQEDNPFKKPDKDLIWRLDYYSQTGNNKNVELISPYNLSEYKMRYVLFPEPIILTNLLTAFPSETLTINGVSLEQTCKLNESVHIEILNRAVELATADYNPQDLAVKTQINNRNE